MVTTEERGDDAFWIEYTFTLPAARSRMFRVRLRRDSLALLPGPRRASPAWIRLAHEQCPNCPFTVASHPDCPVAANLIEVVDFCHDLWSYEEVDVQIATATRTVRMRSAAQNALSGLTGIYMVTSGCPFLDKLRPLVYTHAPFGSLDETMYRALAMYCLAQFFRQRRGLTPDWELTQLSRIYTDITLVNEAFARRLGGLGSKDAGRNALIQLDCYAQYTNSRFVRNALGDLERLFESYFKPD